MSVWSDIRKRGLGGDIKDEEFAEVYNDDATEADPILLKKSDYKDGEYSIWTYGSYPYVNIVINRPLSVFAGAQKVKLEKPDGGWIELERLASGIQSFYTMKFNGEDDFVDGEHPGKKYSVDMLSDIAEHIFDQIIKCENDIDKRLD